MLDKRFVSGLKRAALLTAAVACGTLSSCGFGLQDLRYNMVAGTLGFVKSYTGELWEAVLPDWDELLSANDQ